MTDEEMAEEYAKGLCKTCTVDTCRYSIFQTCAIKESIEQAHLAGQKAGRPKWHILVEEPNTLPKEGQKVRVLTEEGKIEESTLFYDTYYEELAWSNIGLLKVFAWCEIPKYTENTN